MNLPIQQKFRFWSVSPNKRVRIFAAALLSVLWCTASWGWPIDRDSHSSTQQQNPSSVDLGTTFSCHGYPNGRPDLIQWTFLSSRQLSGRMVWSHGPEIYLERTSPETMRYSILRKGLTITNGELQSKVIQFAMTAGGVELHCMQARQLN